MSTSHGILLIDHGSHHIKSIFMDAARLAAVRGTGTEMSNTNNNNNSSSFTYDAFLHCVGASPVAGRGLVGQCLDHLPNYHGLVLRCPLDEGFLVDALLEAHVWEHLLQQHAIADEAAVEVWLTVPMATPKAVAGLLHALLTQRFHFKSATFLSCSFLALVAQAYAPHAHNNNNSNSRKRSRSPAPPSSSSCAARRGCGVVVDVGHAATTITPYLDWLPIYSSTLRLRVGGRHLSQRLQEHLSYTQLNLAEDGWLVNRIKEQCCGISTNILKSLAGYQREDASRHKNSAHGGEIDDDDDGDDDEDENEKDDEDAVMKEDGLCETRRYVLPTIQDLQPLGCVEEELAQHAGGRYNSRSMRSTLQCIELHQERVMLPELLFSPADIVIGGNVHPQVGLSTAVAHAIFERGLLQQLPLLRTSLLANIFIMGGSTNLPGLAERLEADLRAEQEDGALQLHRPANTSLLERRGAQPPLGDAELQPLYGMVLLLTQSEAQQHLPLVEERSRVQLQRSSGKVSVEELHAAMLNVL